MRINCTHGYFTFQETEPGQMSKFISLFGLEIERDGDLFTFSDLVGAKKYSIAGGTFFGLIPATETFEGPVGEVMRENRVIYDFNKGLFLPFDSVIQPVEVDQSGNVFVSAGMLLPGSVKDDGKRVTDYSAFFKAPFFRYSEIKYE